MVAAVSEHLPHKLVPQITDARNNKRVTLRAQYLSYMSGDDLPLHRNHLWLMLLCVCCILTRRPPWCVRQCHSFTFHSAQLLRLSLSLTASPPRISPIVGSWNTVSAHQIMKLLYSSYVRPSCASPNRQRPARGSSHTTHQIRHSPAHRHPAPPTASRFPH